MSKIIFAFFLLVFLIVYVSQAGTRTETEKMVYNNTNTFNAPVIMSNGLKVISGDVVVSNSISEGGLFLFEKYARKTLTSPLKYSGMAIGSDQWDWQTFTISECTITQIIAYGTSATGSWTMAQYPEHTSCDIIRTGYIYKVTCNGTFSKTGDVWVGDITITNGNLGWITISGDGGYPTNTLHWFGKGYKIL